MPSHNPEIQKELLSDYHFPKEDVLSSKTARDTRQLQLNEAQRLGNEFKTKVRIGFLTTDGKHEVITTVWSVAEDIVMFKAGQFVPIHSILYVEKD